MAAIELNNRNWRWHKKMQMWLTKDDVMVPQSLGPTHERGYYVVWDTANWRKERVRDESSSPANVGLLLTFSDSGS
jgi:CCR4-NOT transcriptional regulation complex NOT5 subunit